MFNIFQWLWRSRTKTKTKEILLPPTPPSSEPTTSDPSPTQDVKSLKGDDIIISFPDRKIRFIVNSHFIRKKRIGNSYTNSHTKCLRKDITYLWHHSIRHNLQLSIKKTKSKSYSNRF